MIQQSELSAIWLSLKVAGSSALLLFPVATFMGWLLARRQFRGKFLLESLVHAPLVMPPVVTGWFLLVVFGSNGIIGRHLASLNIHFIFNWKGAVLASIIVAMPLAVRSIRLSISMVDRKLEEAARTLGYTPARVFFRITLPLAWPGVVAGTILAFTRSLGEFGATITFAGNIEGATQTIPLALYSSMQIPGSETTTIRYVVFSLILCISSLILSELFTRWSQRRLNIAAES